MPIPPETWPNPAATERFRATYAAGGVRASAWDFWKGQHNYTWSAFGIVHDTNTNRTFTPGLAQRRGDPAEDKFIHADHIGSTRWLSKMDGTFPNGLRYTAYGQKAWQTGGDWQPADFLFAGEFGYVTEYSTDQFPGAGLLYLQQRYYDPDVGRFLTPDPIGFAGGLNLYAYCGNDPVNRVDPLGLAPGAPKPEDSPKNPNAGNSGSVGEFGGLRPVTNYSMPSGPTHDFIPGCLDNGVQFAGQIPCGGGGGSGRGSGGGGRQGWGARFVGDVRAAAACVGGEVRRIVHSVYADGTFVFKGEQPARLPQTQQGTPIPDPRASGPHTLLRWDTVNGRVYQARQFDAKGNPVHDYDLTVPTSPNGRMYPGHAPPGHIHTYSLNVPGNPKSGWRRGK